MPIEIRELVIRATVEPGGGAGQQKSTGKQEAGKEREELIAECVEQVLEILRKERER